MRETINLSSFLKELGMVENRSDLARVGGYRDGGYVLSYSDVLEASYLISGGVGSNARFESDCLDINPEVKLVLIDKSVNKIRILIRLLYHFTHGFDKGYNSLIEAASTFRILRKSKLIKKFLDHRFTIQNVLSEIPEAKFILKLDIEGGEYSQLESILETESRITALCIEFHDLHEDINLGKLTKFLQSTTLKLAFVSINESSIQKGSPTILELSFSSRESENFEAAYLQASNMPGIKECTYFSTDKKK